MKYTRLFAAVHMRWFTVSALVGMLLAGCVTAPRPGTIVHRTGDEIVVAGQFVHTGTPVVLWLDPGGYDAYRVNQRFGPIDASSWQKASATNKQLETPNRYGLREKALTPAQIEKVRGGGWDLPLLQSVVDEFVIHFDDAGVSRVCFKTLQDERDLSVHFMLDIDGTIYQTLDLKERAWHATTANTRSVGIEVANVGTAKSEDAKRFQRWYHHDQFGETTITLPPDFGDGGIRTVGFVGHPARPNPIEGNVQGQDLYQYDYTPQQYEALVKLTATLCKVFPNLPCRYPTDASGKLITHKLSDDQLEKYTGIMGHYHIQTNKDDPGPAFNWDYLISHARAQMNHGFSAEADATSMGKNRKPF